MDRCDYIFYNNGCRLDREFIVPEVDFVELQGEARNSIFVPEFTVYYFSVLVAMGVPDIFIAIKLLICTELRLALRERCSTQYALSNESLGDGPSECRDQTDKPDAICKEPGRQ